MSDCQVTVKSTQTARLNSKAAQIPLSTLRLIDLKKDVKLSFARTEIKRSLNTTLKSLKA